MEGDRIEMSQREPDRLKVTSLVLERKHTQREAAIDIEGVDVKIERIETSNVLGSAKQRREA